MAQDLHGVIRVILRYRFRMTKAEIDEKLTTVMAEAAPGNNTIFNFSAYPNVPVSTMEHMVKKCRQCFDGT